MPALQKEKYIHIAPADFGKGFTAANLKNMRQFYLTFPKSYALRSELSWTHYRLLMRVENKNAREFYATNSALFPTS